MIEQSIGVKNVGIGGKPLKGGTITERGIDPIPPASQGSGVFVVRCSWRASLSEGAREMDTVRSWLERTIGKVLSWPRWVLFGLLSGAGASTLYIVWVSTSDKNLWLFSSAPVVPLLFLNYYFGISGLVQVPVDFSLGFWFLLVGFWFLLGGLLGKFTDKLGIAVLIWLVIQIICAWWFVMV